MKAKKKPVIIDYFSIEEDYISSHTLGTLKGWVDDFGDNYKDHFKSEIGKLEVKTLEGISYEVTNKDVIIRGIKGEYYPCKKDIFEKTYDKI